MRSFLWRLTVIVVTLVIIALLCRFFLHRPPTHDELKAHLLKSLPAATQIDILQDDLEDTGTVWVVFRPGGQVGFEFEKRWVWPWNGYFGIGEKSAINVVGAMGEAMAQKRFRLSADQIRSVAPGQGSCFASDHITVDGNRVGYMYREQPDGEVDSGWRFLAGTETQAFLDDPANLAIYDVNTIANCDPDIVPLLQSPAPAAFARDKSGAFAKIEPPVQR